MELRIGNQILNCDSGKIVRTPKGEQLVLIQTSPESYKSDLVLYRVNQDGSLKPLRDKHYVNWGKARTIVKNDFVKNIATYREFNALDINSEIAQTPCTIILHSDKHNRLKYYDEYNKGVKIRGEWVAPGSDFLKPVKDSQFLDMGVTKSLRSDMKAFEKFCDEFGKLGNEVYTRVMKQLLKSYLK